MQSIFEVDNIFAKLNMCKNNFRGIYGNIA